MAQRVLLVCDMDDDDRTGAQTVSFAVDGAKYEIDLCADHAGQLRDAMAPFVGAARRAGGGGGGAPVRRARAAAARGGGGRDRTAEIREWARANGHQVSDRGRVPARVVEAYDAAH
jgi:hypothetical protein